MLVKILVSGAGPKTPLSLNSFFFLVYFFYLGGGGPADFCKCIILEQIE